MQRILIFSLIVSAFLFKTLFDNNTNSVTSFLLAQTSMKSDILKAHNKYRAELKLPPLQWSDTLAAHAQKWANHLATLGGRLVHSSNRSRVGEGENLWAGSSGYFSFKQMVDTWDAEKRYFKYGKFPRVSTTGNWASVGHYTQII